MSQIELNWVYAGLEVRIPVFTILPCNFIAV